MKFTNFSLVGGVVGLFAVIPTDISRNGPWRRRENVHPDPFVATPQNIPETVRPTIASKFNQDPLIVAKALKGYVYAEIAFLFTPCRDNSEEKRTLPFLPLCDWLSSFFPKEIRTSPHYSLLFQL